MDKDNEKKLYEILFNINNITVLTNDMITNISQMSEEDKMKIIITYNKMMKWINDVMIT